MRPTWKGSLKLSLVNIPVRMYPAARSQSLSFNQIHKECNSRVKYDKRCPTCERSVSSDEIVKGYEYAKERYVIMDEEDFTKVRLDSKKSINIVQFVNRGEIDPLYYHGSHYVVPDGPVAIESFATILRATELIESITKPFHPEEFADNYKAALLDIVKAKAEGKEIVEPPEVETGKIINLMDALKSSLQKSELAPAEAEQRAQAANE